MENILKYLAKAEGIKIHRNATEDDITTPYGIYRKIHPNHKIFTYIDDLAKTLGIKTPSSAWNQKDIDKVNAALDMVIVDKYTIEFYNIFIKDLHLHIFTEESQLAAFSMYVNGPLIFWKSVQATINKFNSNKWIDYIKQGVDGQFGRRTREGLILIQKLCETNNLYGYIFEGYLVSQMQVEYARLAVANPAKYLKYLNGWNNRVVEFLEF
jgi:hypothetical protein